MNRLRKAILLLIIAVFVSGFVLLGAFGKPDAPQQPIEFNHFQHVKKDDGPQLDCSFCHEHTDKSPHATIPNVTTCMACHEAIKTESPEVQKLAEFANRGQQPMWVRVYWFEPEADVYFTHTPHVRAGVDCSECHGQVGEMQRVRRESDLTMGWCIDCHKQRRVSVDCYICHR